jgi:hypothetical protein
MIHRRMAFTSSAVTTHDHANAARTAVISPPLHSRRLEITNKQFSRDGGMHPYVSCTGRTHRGKRCNQRDFNGLLTTFPANQKKNAMKKPGLIGAAAVLLSLASPAMAKQRGNRHRYHYAHQVPPVRTFGPASGAYDFYPRDDFAPGHVSDDFDRRNTFN